MVSRCNFNLVSSLTNEAEHLYLCLKAAGIFCSVNYVLCPFSMASFVLIHWTLYVKENSPLSMYIQDNFFPLDFSLPFVLTLFISY